MSVVAIEADILSRRRSRRRLALHRKRDTRSAVYLGLEDVQYAPVRSAALINGEPMSEERSAVDVMRMLLERYAALAPNALNEATTRLLFVNEILANVLGWPVEQFYPEEFVASRWIRTRTVLVFSRSKGWLGRAR